jgi:hypothetical protein
MRYKSIQSKSNGVFCPDRATMTSAAIRRHYSASAVLPRWLIESFEGSDNQLKIRIVATAKRTGTA